MKQTTTPSNKDRFVIIMAGGRGERFWPVSREKRPKQLISLFGRQSFLQETVERVRPLVPLRNIFVITHAAQAAEVRRQLPRLPRGNVVAEPCGRDTCAAVTLGAALVGARSTTAVMAVLPADHVIPETRKFQRVLEDAFNLAARGQVMVTIGIEPTEPSTAYGYIRVGDPLPTPRGARRMRTAFFKAEQFVEKPPLSKAIDFVSSGHYRWNAGMFLWSFVTLTEALAQHQPDFADACQRWFKVAASPRLARVLARDYPKLKRVSIDYALMEKARNVVAADGRFAWDDLGSWPALARHLKADAAGNCAVAEFLEVESARNIIYDARSKNRTPVAAVGIKDAILVLTDDAILLADRNQAQEIKKLVARLPDRPKFKKLL